MEDSECIICLDAIKIIASINSCQHKFCFACIQSWAKVTNSCPVCKIEFTKINYTPEVREKAAKAVPQTDEENNKKKRKAPLRKPPKEKSVKVARKTQKVGYEDTGFANPSVLRNRFEDGSDSDDDDDDDDDEDGSMFPGFGFFNLISRQLMRRQGLFQSRGRYCPSCDCYHSESDEDDDDDSGFFSDSDEDADAPRTIMDLSGDVPVVRVMPAVRETGRGSGRLRDSSHPETSQHREVIDLVDSDDETGTMSKSFLEGSAVSSSNPNPTPTPVVRPQSRPNSSATARPHTRPTQTSRAPQNGRQQTTRPAAPRPLTARLRNIVDRS